MPGITNGVPNLILWDRLTGSNTLAAARAPTSEWTSMASAPALSSNGGYVAFQSWSGGYSPGDLNRMADAFATVVTPLVIASPPVVGNGQVTLDFAISAGSTNGFTLLEAGELGAGWTANNSGVLTTNPGGTSYRFTVPTSAQVQFYRIQAN